MLEKAISTEWNREPTIAKIKTYTVRKGKELNNIPSCYNSDTTKVFAGWYTDKECTNSFNGVMPKENITLYAKWDMSKVNYTVEHYMEKIDGSGYELTDRQVYTTDVESTVTPDVENVKGFTSPQKQSVKVTDSTKVIKYYYKRNVHKLTLKYTMEKMMEFMSTDMVLSYL